MQKKSLTRGYGYIYKTHKHNIIYNVFRFTNVNNELLFLFIFFFCTYVVILLYAMRIVYAIQEKHETLA